MVLDREELGLDVDPTPKSMSRRSITSMISVNFQTRSLFSASKLRPPNEPNIS